MLTIGDKTPDFTLTGVDPFGEFRRFSISEFKGKSVILYFYPKDGTQNCTIEACAFRDKLNLISKAIVIGISQDSVGMHSVFKEKYKLNFILLSDSEHEVSDMFGSWDEENQSILRHTFLISGDGFITQEWRDVDVAIHADEVFDKFTDL